MDEEKRLPKDVMLEHIIKVLHAPSSPDIPVEMEECLELRNIHDYLMELRSVLAFFSKGELSPDIRLRGVVAGRLKALQANLLHLTWQIQQVADGDFTQRVDFLGEFSIAFNSMVEQLNTAVTTLQQKEEELTLLTMALQNEIEQKTFALSALRKSEASFRYMAEHDVLTGVLNRRSFYDVAVVELLRSQKALQHCSIGILDIDHFKRFNDTYGHLEGDCALRHVTEIIKAGLRQNDILARYGGEEFVLLFPSADPSIGKSVAERLHKSVAAIPVKINACDAPITISIGLANVPPDTEGKRDVAFLEEILRHADEALYTAKETGRNKLVVSSYPDMCLIDTPKP